MTEMLRQKTYHAFIHLALIIKGISLYSLKKVAQKYRIVALKVRRHSELN
jgi:hypothetical protein